MKSYVPSTPAERQEMLEAIGLSSFAALYADVPESLRLGRELNLPGGMSFPSAACSQRLPGRTIRSF